MRGGEGRASAETAAREREELLAATRGNPGVRALVANPLLLTREPEPWWRLWRNMWERPRGRRFFCLRCRPLLPLSKVRLSPSFLGKPSERRRTAGGAAHLEGAVGHAELFGGAAQVAVLPFEGEADRRVGGESADLL